MRNTDDQIPHVLHAHKLAALRHAFSAHAYAIMLTRHVTALHLLRRAVKGHIRRSCQNVVNVLLAHDIRHAVVGCNPLTICSTHDKRTADAQTQLQNIFLVTDDFCDFVPYYLDKHTKLYADKAMQIALRQI